MYVYMCNCERVRVKCEWILKRMLFFAEVPVEYSLQPVPPGGEIKVLV